MRDSAVRKAGRGLSAADLTVRTAWTALRAHCLAYAAEAVVSQTVLCFRCWRAQKQLATMQVRAPGASSPTQNILLIPCKPEQRLMGSGKSTAIPLLGRRAASHTQGMPELRTRHGW